MFVTQNKLKRHYSIISLGQISRRHIAEFMGTYHLLSPSTGLESSRPETGTGLDPSPRV